MKVTKEISQYFWDELMKCGGGQEAATVVLEKTLDKLRLLETAKQLYLCQVNQAITEANLNDLIDLCKEAISTCGLENSLIKIDEFIKTIK